MSAPDHSRRIWVTRTTPQAEATAARLRAMGLTPVVEPVLEARALSHARVDLTGIDAIVFTSGHAVDAFASLCRERALPAFAVGEATAERARGAGFRSVTSAGGDARALAERIANAEPRPRRVLNPTAREPAADLSALLADRGVAVAAAIVYETAVRRVLPDLSQIDAILLHSPKAARALASAIKGGPDLGRLEAYAISEAAAEPLRELGLRSVSVAPRPNEVALLALLKG